MRLGREAEGIGSTPAHLVAIDGEGRWALWRPFVVRGAGFPAARILALAAHDAASAADECIAAEALVESTRRTALAAVQATLDGLRDSGRWETDEARELVDEQRALCKGKSRGKIAHPDILAALATWQAAKAGLVARQAGYLPRFQEGIRSMSRAIRSAASDHRFQQAVLWQNRNAFRTGVLSLLNSPVDARNSDVRQKEELIANYLQRYCVKNDTIGFFGPSCWGRIADEGAAITMDAGPQLVSSRGVYFESWCIEALALTVEKEGDNRRWAVPQLGIRIEGQQLFARTGVKTLSAGDAALLTRCDGKRSAEAIAAELLTDSTHGFDSGAQILARLDEYRRQGIVAWCFDVPMAPHSEKSLRAQFEKIGDAPVRDAALARLQELENGRAAIASAADDTQALDRALGDLAETFTRLTGAASTRAAGRTYAGRTLVYEDCNRDLNLTLGPALRAALDPVLELLLAGAQWFVHHFSSNARLVLQRIYEELARKTGTTEIDLVTYWYRLMPELMKPDNFTGTSLVDFRERWAAVLAAMPGENCVARSSAAIRSQALQAFAAPRAAYEIGRYHSPDLMIAADGVDAIQRGDYHIVLGEMHLAANTLNSWVFLAGYSEREDIGRCVESDLGPRIVAAPPKQWPGLTTRCQTAYFSPKDHMMGYWKSPLDVPEPGVLHTSQLIVVDRGNGVAVESRDGKMQLDILAVFGASLTHNLGGTFEYVESGDHTPRVMIDRVVISRETWRLPASDLTFAFEQDAAKRFQQARAFSQSRQLPRFVFAKAAVEKKPFYVDFASPIYIDAFAKVVRRTAESGKDPMITLSEMLPSPEQLWLSDAQGQRFTSELRFAALELPE